MYQEFKSRWQLVDAALRKYLGTDVSFLSSGGTSFWIKGPRWLDADLLQLSALNSGILIESGSVFFMQPPKYNNYFRLGFSSISSDKIEPGNKKLSLVIEKLRCTGT